MSKGKGEDFIKDGNAQPAQKPKGIIDAISAIQRFSAMEAGGSEIPPSFYSDADMIDYFEVGFKGAFVSGLITALFTPFAIGVMEKMIPAFGAMAKDPTLEAFDTLYSFMLALSFSAGYAFFISRVAQHYIGNITKQMVRDLLTGMVTGAVLKMGIAFILFHIVYYLVWTVDNARAFFKALAFIADDDTLYRAFRWSMQFRPVFLQSAWFIVLSTLIFMGIPLGNLYYNIRKRKKEKEAM